MQNFFVKKHLQRWVVVLGLLLAGIACNFPLGPIVTLQPTLSLPTAPIDPLAAEPLAQGSPTPPGTAQPAAPTPAYQAVFEEAGCAFSVPVGFKVRCGYLVVPENRRVAGSQLIRLHAAVFASRAPNPAPDPVIYLSGGPGSPALDLVGYLFRSGLDAVLERSDLIVFDQRGTGYSQPRLDCPERQNLAADLLSSGLATENAARQIVNAYHRCRERMAFEGVDLAAYNSAVSAADVNDLRLALGYSQINLYGVSYGTRLGLTLMRDYPEALRSVVLDSVYPPQVNLYTALAPNAERSFERLFARCGADPGCSARYPDLRAVFYSLVDQLNASPVAVSLDAGGFETTARVDGGLLIDVLFVGMYNPAVTVRMPEMIYDTRQGEYGLLRERLSLYFDSSSALGMNMAVQCAEEIPFNRKEDAYTAAQNVQAQIAAFYPPNIAPFFEICEEWNPLPPDPRENQPVSSDVPTLLLAGDLDPITPPEWAQLTTDGLATSYFYLVPGNGHWVTRSSSCALQLALTFWQDPFTSPGKACE